MSFIKVDLPAPEVPTKARKVPGSTLRSICLRSSIEVPGILKVTPRQVTRSPRPRKMRVWPSNSRW